MWWVFLIVGLVVFVVIIFALALARVGDGN